MTFHILTLFPEMFESVFSQSILKRAQSLKNLKVEIVNIRDFAGDKHKTVDDKPYGGGRGMVMKVDVLVKALESIGGKPYSILLSASGEKYTQKSARILANKSQIAIICGHYEGTDARVEKFADKTYSVGDFILTGGEIAAMAIVDSTTRLIPKVINPESLKSESFAIKEGLLEFPQYTRPEDFRGLKVPKILLSGNHREIERWRKAEALKKTKENRPDLLKYLNT